MIKMIHLLIFLTFLTFINVNSIKQFVKCIDQCEFNTGGAPNCLTSFSNTICNPEYAANTNKCSYGCEWESNLGCKNKQFTNAIQIFNFNQLYKFFQNATLKYENHMPFRYNGIPWSSSQSILCPYGTYLDPSKTQFNSRTRYPNSCTPACAFSSQFSMYCNEECCKTNETLHSYILKNNNNVGISACPIGYITGFELPLCGFLDNLNQSCKFNEGMILYPLNMSANFTALKCKYFKELDCESMGTFTIVGCPQGCLIDPLSNQCFNPYNDTICGVIISSYIKCPLNWTVNQHYGNCYHLTVEAYSNPQCDDKHILRYAGKYSLQDALPYCFPKWYYDFS
jgi:hypothetical protein